VTQSDSRLLSLIFLCFAVLIGFGHLTPAALFCVVVSIGLAARSLSTRPWGPPVRRATGIGLVLLLAATTLLYNLKLGNHVFLETFGGLAVAILVCSLVRSSAARLVAFGLAAVASLVGIATNLSWGFADIDVFHFQQNAAQAVLNGQDPYTPVAMSPNVIAPGVIRYIPLHLPYGPIVSILEAPVRLLGDIRVLHILAAVVTAIAVLLLARRAGTLDRSARVVMAFPLTVGMVLFSWVDIITMAGFAVWIVLYRTHPRIATVALALALGAKPTTLIALVPIFFWSVRARRQVVIAAVMAALVVLPFAAATGFSQFYYDVVGIQLSVFPRLDALTFNSMLSQLGLPLIPFSLAAVVIGLTVVAVLRRRPETYGDLLTGTAVIVTASFLVAKWAFFNYYYIAAVLLLLAIAGDRLALDVPDMIRPPALLVTLARRLRGGVPRVPRLGGPTPAGVADHGVREPVA
jgi:hypothetical protein